MICVLDPGMGADDLLPLFTYVLALSNCKHIQTNIAYVSALLSKRAADGLAGYAFTTMQLAVEYVSQTCAPQNYHIFPVKFIFVIFCRYSENNVLSEANTSSLPSTISGGGSSSLLTTTISGVKTSGGSGDPVGRQSKTMLSVLLTELMSRAVVAGGGGGTEAPVKTFQQRVRLPPEVALVESFSCEWLPGGFTVGFCRGVLHVCDGGLAFEPLAICPSSAAWSAIAQTIDSVMPSSYALVINSALCVRMKDGTTREFAMFFGRAAAISAMVCLRKFGVKVMSRPSCPAS
jgi:hypothetical protein